MYFQLKNTFKKYITPQYQTLMIENLLPLLVTSFNFVINY
jgi:hypothetical protein